ncbi:biotin--[acetyl-CoA-carboxylase] ligase [Tessaracoccus caeni]|uniref:biotin--[acetyl-CoA-carboxylase] ligase n=1 Tax=Tessaracoccus caeni TaxID=3031239 RepID=UPI0023DA2A48|nr:biotin--[acetyl-CoA-carboxylase] ligase [Tessaracoccus caeni]MDF1488907.1 biotin--[acetyl-CoA-carboxylase] ligase [Tessaracoccus caeni]
MPNDATRLDELTSLLGPRTMWRPVEWVPTTGSTNADLSARARLGETEGAVRIADEQTSGRGRLARTWVSPARSSVAISVLLKPEHGPTAWGWLSLLAGMAITEALEELSPAGVSVELKWPNDVLIDGKKVCGILSERIEHADGARAVVGMGINIALTEDELPVPNATSLALAGFEVNTLDVVAGVLRHFENLYRGWREDPDLRVAYQRRCASVGAELRIVVSDTETVTGRGVGVDEFGRLLVETARGVRAFAVGDVIHARLPR